MGRSGTTLVQRLLNSSKEVVIFGENRQFVEYAPPLVMQSISTHLHNGVDMDRIREKFRSQGGESWEMNRLWPDTLAYADCTVRWFQDLVQVYQRSAEELGHQRWGIKHPVGRLEPLDQLRQLLPGGRYIYVYRDLIATARSAKARGFVDADGMEGFGRGWACNLEPALDRVQENFMLLRYEDLVSNPTAWIEAISLFTDVQGMDASVMERKINVHQKVVESSYVEPAPVSGAEIEALVRGGGSTLVRAGYGRGGPASLLGSGER